MSYKMVYCGILTLSLCVIVTCVMVPAGVKLRRAVTPCLTCTVLNRDQCCTRHKKCCGSRTETNTNSPQVRSGNPNLRQPVGPVINNRQPYNRQNGAAAIGSCPARRTMARLRQSCANTCSNDDDCRLENTRCCPPPVLCCRPLDNAGQCPNTVISARCCRSCLSSSTCRRGEGCCAQPGHEGCCVTGSCVGNRCGGGRNVNVIPSSSQGQSQSQRPRDTDTVGVPIDVPATVIPPSSSSRAGGSSSSTTPASSRGNGGNDQPDDVTEILVYEDDDGQPYTVTQTIHVNENGVTLTILKDENGSVETITKSEVVTTETQYVDRTVDHVVEVIISVIEDVTYTFTKGEDGKETATYTVVDEDGVEEVLITVHDPNEVVRTVYEDHTIDKTENPVVMTEYYTEEVVYVDGIKKGKEEGEMIVDGIKQQIASDKKSGTVGMMSQMSSATLDEHQLVKVTPTVDGTTAGTTLQPSFSSDVAQSSVIKTSSSV